MLPRLTAALAGRYGIDRELGQGGMATVYLAHDTRHDRKVALKVLRPELSAIVGADRFLAEIKTTANLHHPHILPLHDSGEADGLVYYVMPYIEGESLRDRLKREHQLPIEEAVRIATEVASALDYAHRHHVVHRDIKPENILLQDGAALVVDFGIALAVSRSDSGTRLTETGMSLGTPHYMAPEQAMGEREITPKVDIYALGCVLYEMLSGEPPFTGPSAQAIVAKVMTEEPRAISLHRHTVPPYVEAAVLQALEKLPADRFQTAAAFATAIGAEGSVVRLATRPRARGAGSGARPVAPWRGWLVAGGAAIALMAAAGGWVLGRGGAGAPSAGQPSRLAILEPGSGLSFNGVARTIDISADGQIVVYVASHELGTAIQTRRLDGAESDAIPNSRTTAHLRLSPDGRFLYAAPPEGPTMQRMSLGGGTWTPVPGLEATSFLAFSKDGTLWWASLLSYGSYRRGPDGRDSLVFPRTTITQVLPDGRHGIGVGVTTGANSGDMQWLDLKTGEIKSLFDFAVVEARYTMGYLVYVLPDGVLMAVPFDAAAGTVTGPSVEIARDVAVTGLGFAQMGVSDNGTVAFIPGFDSHLVRVSRDGNVRVLLEERRRYHSPRISPDGRRIAFDDVQPDGRDIWLYTDGTRALTRATFQRDGHDPVWTLDGRGLYYLAGRGGRLDIFRTQLGTTTPPRAESTGVELSYTGTPLRNGTGFLTMIPATVGRGVDIARVAPGGKVDTVLATPADETFAVPSPDGRWFAYISDHSGRAELYVRAFGGSDAQLQVSLDGAAEPVWSRDGRELFYRRPTAVGAELVAATISLAGDPRVVARTSLFDVSGFDTASPHANYDVSPDARWFVFTRRGSSDHIVVIQHLPELARRTARAGAP